MASAPAKTEVYISTKSTHNIIHHIIIHHHFSSFKIKTSEGSSRKYGEDLAQYNAWEQLEIFRTRMKVLESPLLLSSSAEIQGLQDFENDENEVKKSSDLLPPLVRISLCEGSSPAEGEGEK